MDEIIQELKGKNIYIQRVELGFEGKLIDFDERTIVLEEGAGSTLKTYVCREGLLFIRPKYIVPK